MKAVINEKETQVKTKYPCLKKWNGNGPDIRVVQFTSENTGTLVYESNGKYLGLYSTEWSEEYFTPFTGSITLSND